MEKQNRKNPAHARRILGVGMHIDSDIRTVASASIRLLRFQAGQAAFSDREHARHVERTFKKISLAGGQCRGRVSVQIAIPFEMCIRDSA